MNFQNRARSGKLSAAGFQGFAICAALPEILEMVEDLEDEK